MNNDGWRLFGHALRAVFAHSTIFTIIRDNRSARVAAVLDDLEQDIFYWFQNVGEVFPDEIALHIETVLQSINTEMEYDDAMELGRLVHLLYVDAVNQRYEAVQTFVASITPMHANVTGGDRPKDISDSESSGSGDSAPDDDGEASERTNQSAWNSRREADSDGWFMA